MNTDRPKPETGNIAEHGHRPKAFLGVRNPVAKALLAVLVLAAIVLGAYMVYDRYVLSPRRHEAIQSGEAVKRRYARWQRIGPRGWERLFAEAANGYPGYNVDTGRPARLKLVELGEKVVSFADKKLEDPRQAVRITAVYVLAAVGEPQDRIAELLIKEVNRASIHNEAVEAMKCANALDGGDRVLERVALAALESPYRKAREVAAGYLVYLANKPGADPQLRQHLNELEQTADIKVRVELAVQTVGSTPVETYNLLLEMLDSGDEEVRTIAVNHVARLRDGDPIRDNTLPEAIAGILERHRRYLNIAIAAARIDEDWRAAFRALDEGTRDEDEQMVLGVINLVNALRELPPIFGAEDIKTRGPKMAEQCAFVGIGAAAANADSDPVAAYTALLGGLSHADPKTVHDVAVVVARLRGLPPRFDPDTEEEAIAEQRGWVQQQLDEATAAAAGSAEPTDEAGDSSTTDDATAPDDETPEAPEDGASVPEGQ